MDGNKEIINRGRDSGGIFAKGNIIKGIFIK